MGFEHKRLVVVVVRTFVLHEGVCPATRTLAPNLGGRTPGSKLPASPHPFPALMAGVRNGRVPVHTALKRRQLIVHNNGHVNDPLRCPKKKKNLTVALPPVVTALLSCG